MPIKSLVTALVIICVIIACKKNSTEENSNTIEGRWKLKETLMDPGDGSGTWQPATVYGNPSNLYLQFFADSTVQGDASFFAYYDRYYTTPDAKIYMIKSAIHDTARMSYSIVSGKLTLNPQCFEACGFRFVRSH